MENVWNKVLSEIQLEVSPATFATLFKNTQLSSLEKDVATIACPSPMLSNLIETRYYSLLKKTLDKYVSANTSIIFITADGVKKMEKVIGPLFLKEEGGWEAEARRAHLNRLFTFENFAVSSTNQLAFAASQTVAQKIAAMYNPLFIYGGVGVGKTHLMQAIGNDILARKPKTKLIYCAGEEFTNELIFSIRTKSTKDFKERFRKTDVLLVDDVQFIAGKEAVQEEFFHTFNAIQAYGGQIVLTSDKPPSEIKNLERRLVSRFDGGLTVDIEPPDFELRTAIVLIKSRLRGGELPINIAKIIAENVKDTRRLEGVLIRLMTESETRRIPINEGLAAKVSGAARAVKEEGGRFSKDSLLEVICSYYQVKPTQLRSAKRDAPLTLPRHVLMYLLRTELGICLSEIGNFLGGRDHTTVMHAVDKIERLFSTSERVKGDILWIKNEFVGNV